MGELFKKSAESGRNAVRNGASLEGIFQRAGSR
jgi:hypothetical protein